MILDCPHCGTKHVQMTERTTIRGYSEVWQILACQNPQCGELILHRASASDAIVKGTYPSGRYEFDEELEIPQEIRNDYREAGMCLDAGCYKASMVMSRRALQRILKEQGCTQHNLVDAIKHAVDNNILRKAFHPLATEIRQYGNLSAHPDDDQLQNATAASAKQILGFLELIVREFYEIPSLAKSLKTNREGAAAQSP